MKFDIIKPDFLRSHKFFSPYYKFIVLLAVFISLLRVVDKEIMNKNKTLSIIAFSIIALYFIAFILNSFLFTRIGNIEFNSEKIMLNKKDIQTEFLHSNIKLIKIKKEQNNHYQIEAIPLFKETIELKNQDLKKLKKFLDNNDIEYQHKSIINWLNE
ncbi:hypothetical protein WH52_14140 [Tenacibaculum holothuriorum]|uniref:Uncharacterized protein n=1 Tax=Tenacibaculum holothuriorum TaxID=1635173 RepID=A0A1Y2P9R8_9FLAO|nr:hypothetical protein [Tenacibaculum holothuriorum]OSY86920.1 hypothetical protein WH52_14140 [Tenacibaculum holothuriorum]